MVRIFIFSSFLESIILGYFSVRHSQWIFCCFLHITGEFTYYFSIQIDLEQAMQLPTLNDDCFREEPKINLQSFSLFCEVPSSDHLLISLLSSISSRIPQERPQIIGNVFGTSALQICQTRKLLWFSMECLPLLLCILHIPWNCSPSECSEHIIELILSGLED